MKVFNNVLIVFTMVINPNHFVYSQASGSTSGYITDKATGEPLPYANILIRELKVGTSSNIDGFYYLPRIPEGKYTLVCSYIGYRPFESFLEVKPNGRLRQDIKLEQTPIEFEEVRVEGRTRNTDAPVSVISLVQSDIRRAATPGEADLNRMLVLLPGITFNHELSSKIYIRGADSGQTLVLIDGVPVFSPNHLFGIYSSFNVNVIKNVQVIKGGFPAQYGGRSGSVIDITHKEGNKEKTSMEGSVGLVSSNFNAEGPLKNGSWFLGMRRTYFDVPKQILNNWDSFKKELLQYPDYYFYDVTGKATVSMTDKDKLTFSSFFSRDYLDYKNYEGRLDNLTEEEKEAFDDSLLLEQVRSSWSNGFLSIRWNRNISPSFQSNLQTYFTRYNTDITSTQDLMGISWVRGVNQFVYFRNTMSETGIKHDFQYMGVPEHHFKFGFWGSLYSLDYSGETPYSTVPNVISGQFPHLGAYFSDAFKFNSRTQVILGMRTNYYSRTKSRTLEPRLFVRYALTDYVTLKAATGIFYQFLVNVAPPTFLSLTTADFWFPVDESVSPVRSKQAIAGFELNLPQGLFLDVEAYTTRINNAYELKNINRRYTSPGEILRVGDGFSRGVEVWLERNQGRITGWLSYTYSESERSFAEINNGNRFPVRWNRLHELTSVLSLNVGKQWYFDANWYFSTGQPFTAPLGKGYIHLSFLEEHSGAWGSDTQYSARNIYRLPFYHRLDISMKKEFRFRGWDMAVNLTIFNAYFHRNAISYEGVDSDGSDDYQTLLPTIPSISLEFKR